MIEPLATTPGMQELADPLYEELLVARCQAGDESAFAEIVARYGRRIRYFLVKMCGEGEDVAQEVWLEVWRSISRLGAASAFATWLYTIARRRAMRHVSRRLGRHEHWETDQLAEIPDSNVDYEHFTTDDARQVHAAIDVLPPAQREVIVMRFLEDMPYEDIARVAGCNVGTVRSRLFYAKANLRKALENPNRS
jgi:RNA polymerase sigma-70 factor, ECF subfamily